MPTAGYLILYQHGDVHKHVMKLLDAALQPHNVLVPPLDLTERLLGNLRVDDLRQATQRPTISQYPCHSPHSHSGHAPASLPHSLPAPAALPSPTTRSSTAASPPHERGAHPSPPTLTPEVKMAGFPLSSISSSSSSVVFLPALQQKKQSIKYKTTAHPFKSSLKRASGWHSRLRVSLQLGS